MWASSWTITASSTHVRHHPEALGDAHSPVETVHEPHRLVWVRDQRIEVGHDTVEVAPAQGVGPLPELVVGRVEVGPVAAEPAGELVDHPVAGLTPQMGGDDHDDPVALPVGPGRLLPAWADPDLDMGMEQGGILDGVGHGPDGMGSM